MESERWARSWRSMATAERGSVIALDTGEAPVEDPLLERAFLDKGSYDALMFEIEGLSCDEDGGSCRSTASKTASTRRSDSATPT